jgi:hypothetical protein
MSEINVRNMPIEIISISTEGIYEGVKINVGGIPAAIFDPNVFSTKEGIVYLFSTDRKNGNWSKLIKLTKGGKILKGFTDDPRLVKIAEMILADRITELQPGTIIPPLNE